MIASCAGQELNRNRFAAYFIIQQMQQTEEDVFEYFIEIFEFYKKKWPNMDVQPNHMKHQNAVDLILCCFLNKWTIVAGLEYLNILPTTNFKSEKEGLLVLGYTRLIAHEIKYEEQSGYVKDVLESATFDDMACLKQFITNNAFWEAVRKEFEYANLLCKQ